MKSSLTPKERFIRACLCQEVDRPPVWMMRQAGRYLPEYQAIKKQHPTKVMMQTPEIACEITLQPVAILGVDAAILYSDILMIPDALGMDLSFVPGDGPTFGKRLSTAGDLTQLHSSGFLQRLSYVFESIELCLKKLPANFPLLGFAGAPFTVAYYMLRSSSDDFATLKGMVFRQDPLFTELMESLTQMTLQYLIKQADAGVSAVQIFDTWAGLFSDVDYRQFIMPYTERLFKGLKEKGILSIHYIKGGSHLLPSMQQMSSNVVSVDWRVDLQKMAPHTFATQALQGNFDPDYLLSSPEFIKERVRAMMASVKTPKKGYIVNLGHGIDQKTPVEHAKLFVKESQSYC